MEKILRLKASKISKGRCAGAFCVLLKNTKDEFGFIAKFFHWAVAVLVLVLLSAGFFMTGMDFSPSKLGLYMLHKSFGILVLVLMIGRVIWRQISPRPGRLPSVKPWEDRLASIVHLLLYLSLFAMPLSGWIMSSAGGFPATFFGLFSLPALMDKNEQVFELTRGIHTAFAYTVLGLLALHFAGAFKHHLVDRDATLQRMTTPALNLWWGMLLAAIAGLLWTSPLALEFLKSDEPSAAGSEQVAQPVVSTASEGWIIDLSNSQISFEATQYGEAFQGRFKNFGGKIIFDAAKLDEAYADIWIDISSIETGSADRDAQARSAEWFDVRNFPRAQFVADSFSETAPGQYIAHGALTIRNKPVLVDLPFTLQIRESPEGQAALMESHITLNRLDFGIGQGQWQETEAIGAEVKITLQVLATLQ